MKNKFFLVLAGVVISFAGAEESGDSIEEHFKKNYSYNAQVGAQYTQGYYDVDGKKGKNNFQSLYAYLGFEGLEFERLRFGLNLMGSVKLGRNGSIYSQDIGANAILYQGFIGYTSNYFDLSVGREELDLEWVNDYVEGARFAVKIPQGGTEIKAFWFYRQAVADYNEITPFEDNRIGHTIIAGISNNSYEPLLVEAYFINLDSVTRYATEDAIPSFNGAWLGANLNYGNDFVASSTSLKYAYLNSKLANFTDLHFLQVEENLEFNLADYHKLGVQVGVMKVFNKNNGDNVVTLNALGDQRPLEQGDSYLYNTNALSAYIGLNYGFADWLEVALAYGNTSGSKDEGKKVSPINEIDLSLTGKYAGLEAGFVYSKLLGNTNFNESDSKAKLNQDYFEAFVAYNF